VYTLLDVLPPPLFLYLWIHFILVEFWLRRTVGYNFKVLQRSHICNFDK
jgi:hypothetical protein